MTRINTNVSSLNAQKSLAKSNSELQEALTRLSTGLRINSGKDDPAGLIASEVLRSDIISVERAITNSERANQMIATADSALGQVSSLLNDIRGLISEAANEGALSQEQIQANQLQVDSSLEAIDRIAQVTQFQGKRLLDGSLDFVTDGVDGNSISNLQIDQANFGTSNEISVGVKVKAQATQATLTYEGSSLTSNAVIEVGGSDGYETFSFAAGSTVEDMKTAINLVSDSLGVTASIANRTAETATHGTVTFDNSVAATDDSFTITANNAGSVAGDFTVLMEAGAEGAATSAAWNNGVIEVTLGTTTGATATNAADVSLGGTATMTLAAQQDGEEYNEVKIHVTQADNGGVDLATYDYDSHTIHVVLDTTTTTTAADVEGAINDNLSTIFTASAGNANDVTLNADHSGFTNNDGVTGEVVNATVKDVRDAIDSISQVSASACTSTDTINWVTQSSRIGDVNASETTSASEPNNLIQLTTTGGADDMSIDFNADEASQTLGVDLVVNSRTGGYSTAYIQGTTGVLQVQAVSQGTDWDGVTIKIEDTNGGTGDTGAVYDSKQKILTVYADFGGGTLSVSDAADLITETGLFTGTALVEGTFAEDKEGETSDGKIYDSVTVNLGTDANGVITSTAAEVVKAINDSTELQSMGIIASNAFSSDGSGQAASGIATFAEQGVTASDDYAEATTYATNGTNAQITVTAKTAGSAYDNVQIAFVNDEDVTGGVNEYATYDADNKILTFHVQSGVSTAEEVAENFLNGSGTSAAVKALFSVDYEGTGASEVTDDDFGWTTGGIAYDGTSTGGMDSVGNYDAGDIVGTGGLVFQSTEYGSDQFVSIIAKAGTFATVDSDGNTTERDNGSDVNVQVNGIGAVGAGLKATINTSSLDLSFYLDSSLEAGDTTSFTITEGGALFQLGPDVVSNQQARLGISSVSTSTLGGVSGYLYQLRSGNVYDLDSNTSQAARIADEVITEITTLRGRLGAFQSTTLESNINTLNDTLEALTEAESSIRDADFAAESAALTRAQILVQSGTSVLSMANSNPQNVLALLQ